MAWPGDAAGHGHLRASHADRERVVDTLKAAFAQGRLTKDDFDARIGQTLASRTYAELATVTAGIPPRRPEAPAHRRRSCGCSMEVFMTRYSITPAF